jgi:hypothetical protein
LAKKRLNVTRQSLAAVAPTGKWLDEQAVLRASILRATWLVKGEIGGPSPPYLAEVSYV